MYGILIKMRERLLKPELSKNLQRICFCCKSTSRPKSNNGSEEAKTCDPCKSCKKYFPYLYINQFLLNNLIYCAEN